MANPPAGSAGTVQAADPGQVSQTGLAGLFGGKTQRATGPNAAAYDQQRNAAQTNASNYGEQALNYTQNAPTIANAYQAQSRAGIAQNVGQEQGVANSYGALAGQEGGLANTLMQNNGQASRAQFQQGLDQSIAAQMAAANSSPGGAVAQAGARRAAQEQAGQMQAQGAATAAGLGAQEREASLAQAAGVYNNMGNAYGGQAGVYGQVGQQQQAQYGLEQQSAEQQAQLQSTNQAQQDQYRLGMGALGNQAQGQSEQALNDYTQGNLQSQGLTAGVNAQNSAGTNQAIGTVSGLLGQGAASVFGGGGGGPGKAVGGPISPHGAPPSVSSLYGRPPSPVQRPATLAEALHGIEHLKARIAELEARHG